MTGTQVTDRSLELRVDAVHDEAAGVKCVTLVAPNGGALPPFTAGSHIELTFATPAFPEGLRRHYSLLNDPEETHRYVIGVALHPRSRGGSRFVHDSLRVGASLQSTPPRNRFPLEETAEMTIFIAGGIGVTPLLSMARRLSRLNKPWRFYYCVRTSAQAAFRDQLFALPGGDVVTVHDGCPGVAPLNMQSVMDSASPGVHLYCCGPAGMMSAFERAGQSRAPSTLHVEWFEAPAASTSDATSTLGAITVHLAKSGKTVHVLADQSILCALEAAGIEVPNSCGDGICGTCETRVLRGTPVHRDHVLTPAERAKGDRMMVCVSRCVEPELTLEL